MVGLGAEKRPCPTILGGTEVPNLYRLPLANSTEVQVDIYIRLCYATLAWIYPTILEINFYRSNHYFKTGLLNN